METPITRNSIQNPYKEFEITIPALGLVPIYYAFDFIRYIDFGGAQRGEILARIGSSGNESDIVGGGIGYKLNTAVDRIDFRNTTANPITIIIALAIGIIYDDRLNFTGDGVLNVAIQRDPSTIVSSPDVTLAAATATQILAANLDRNEAFIYNLTGDVIRIGDASITASRGLLIESGQSIIINTQGAIFGYSVSGGTVTAIQTEV